MGAPGRRLREREGQGLGHEGPRSKVRIHTGDRGEVGGFSQLLLAMLPDWCQAGRCFTTLSLAMGAGLGRMCRKERSRRATKLEQDRQGGLRGLGSLLSLV